MKQVLALFLCIAMLFLSACGGGQQSTAEEPTVAMEEALQEESAPIEEADPFGLPVLEVRENPLTERTEEDIAVFGNTEGIIACITEDVDLPNLLDESRRFSFESDRITFICERGTYLVDGYMEKTEKLLQAMETATGLPFADAKIMLFLEDAGNRHSDFDYVGGVDAPNRMVQIGQGEGFMGNSWELIAYIAQVLQMDNAPQTFTEALTSGFAVYTAYDVLSWLEENNPDLYAAFSGKHQVYDNYYIHDPDTLYSASLEDWLESEYPYGQSNGSPALGFWLMKYLDEAYGDYTKWITAYDASNGTLDLNGQLQLLKDAYGEAVLDGFYPWLQETLGKVPVGEIVSDYTQLREFICYPYLTEYDFPKELLRGECADLCISFAQYRYYLTQVKEFTIDTLTLIKYTDTEVALYDAEGKFLHATKGTQTPEGAYLVCLDDAYYIRLLDSGFQDLYLDLTYTYP